MSEWITSKLSELAVFEKGRKVETALAPHEGWLPYLGASAIEGKVTAFASPESGVIATDNDLLMLWDGERSGLVGRADRGVVGSTVARISSRGVDSGFLYYSLQRSYPWIQARRTGTGIPHVPSNLGEWLELLHPESLQEQRLISHILFSLDTQIQKTEALIAKLEKVKEGLLHDLLTRGIDENGQLRPRPEQAPELYKESPLGLIPRQWEVKRLGGLIDGIDAGWSPSCSDVVPKEGEWGVLKVSAISTGAYLPHKSKTLPEGLSPIKEIEVNSGDVICVRANGVAELVGRTAYVFSTPRRLMLSDKTLRLRAGEGLDPLFLFLLMGSASTRKQIASFISGSSGQKNLSQNQINSIQVKAPSIEEQRRVAGALSSMASRIEKEKSARDSSATLKAGLMGDLLTGRVRVTPLLEKAQATSPA